MSNAVYEYDENVLDSPGYPYFKIHFMLKPSY